MKNEDLNNLSDEDLVSLYKKGDLSAVNIICERYKPLVLKFSKSFFLVGGETDDLIQEGMIGLFSAIGDYDLSSEVTFFHFANLCIKRQIIKAIEASNTKKNEFLNSYVSIYDEDDTGEKDDILGFDSNPEELFIEAESTSILLNRLLESLSTNERTVFDLYMKGFDYKEIALKLGKENKSIDNTLTRIRMKAKKLQEGD